jgi:hypothetical protein
MKLFLIILALSGGLIGSSAYAGCTYKQNWNGNTEYTCDNGATGELKKNWKGELEDTGSGTNYRENWKGNVE